MIDTILDYPWRIAIIAVILAAVGIWFQVDAPSTVKLQSIPEDAWKLPVITRSPADKTLAIISKNKLWGDMVGSDAANVSSLNEPEWRFSGVTQAGKEKVLLITKDGKLVEPPLKEGDKLPGGAKILAIHDDYLCILIEGKKRKLEIFQ